MDSKRKASEGGDATRKKKKKPHKAPLIIPVIPKVKTADTRRELINGFHNTVKKAEIVAEQEPNKIEEVHQELQQLGGLQRYQEASLLGQNSGYRYNTAKWVVKQLKTYNVRPPAGERRRLTLLDVGSLCNNYVDVPWLDVLAIDLNPCHPSVQKMDFFELDIARLFDIVVLSLVVNFVGTPAKRGEMLRRSAELIREGGHLFLVVPKACVANSRYMDDELLIEILTSLNLRLIMSKHSTKLAFCMHYAFTHHSITLASLSLTFPPTDVLERQPGAVPSPLFEKKLRHKGATRNGFCITLDPALGEVTKTPI